MLSESSNKEEVMHTAMGQGKTQITPLHLNMVVSAVANKGVMMKSYVVDHLESADGNLVRKYQAQESKKIMPEDEPAVLTTYMKAVVDTGPAPSPSGFS